MFVYNMWPSFKSFPSKPTPAQHFIFTMCFSHFLLLNITTVTNSYHLCLCCNCIVGPSPSLCPEPSHFYLYSSKSQITHLPQGALKSVQHTTPYILRPSIWRKNSQKKSFNGKVLLLPGWSGRTYNRYGICAESRIRFSVSTREHFERAGMNRKKADGPKGEHWETWRPTVLFCTKVWHSSFTSCHHIKSYCGHYFIASV